MIWLSSIFDWYERDFSDWVEEKRPELPTTLHSYVLSQLGPADAARLASCEDCRVEFVDYDWSLNDAR